MDFKGRHTITAAPEAVWAALNDPDVLSRCIPGCRHIEKLSPEEFRAGIEVKIGPVKAHFEGKVRIVAKAPEAGHTHAATLVGEGQGGAAGFAKGVSELRLARQNGATVLTYDAKANVGGRLAQIGQRLIDGAAKAIAEEFFAKFAQEVAKAEAQTPSAPLDVPAAKGIAAPIWVIGIIVIILAAVAGFVLLG